MSHTQELDHRALYRLPWTDADNVLSWLEPTSKCNLACEGCYRENVNEHKSLAEVRADLDVFNKFRIHDSVSIAGGNPLLHPNIVDIVKMVVADGHKPILNTNGLALTEGFLRDLKKAGLVGLTFHVDSRQGRPGWKGKTGLDLNQLRLNFAEMVARVGGLSCAFNSTVYEDTLQYVPELVQFAGDHIDIIDTMVFILYRAAVEEGAFDFFHDGKQVNAKPLVYSVEETKQRVDLNAREVVKKLQERFPDFMPSAYLGGTEKTDSFKWLFTGRFGFPAHRGDSKVMGYVGPKFMEYVQNAHHMVKGRYMAYAPKWTMEAGRSSLAMGLVEPGMRTVAKNYAKHVVTKPLDALKKLHYQTVLIIQPIDMMEDGRQSMCDGCPDVTVFNGQLVWSCRLEEYKKYGGLVQCVPKACAKPAAAPTVGDPKPAPQPDKQLPAAAKGKKPQPEA